MCIDTLDDSDEGIRIDEEGVGFIGLVDHLVDLWDLQIGGWASPRWGEEAAPSLGSRARTSWLPGSPRFDHTTKPIVGVDVLRGPRQWSKSSRAASRTSSAPLARDRGSLLSEEDRRRPSGRDLKCIGLQIVRRATTRAFRSFALGTPRWRDAVRLASRAFRSGWQQRQ